MNMHRAYTWLALAACFATSALAAEDYQLDNGMSVVLEENHASPMIAAMVFVKAGAKYETPQNNGVTHFLEHLLFNGTPERARHRQRRNPQGHRQSGLSRRIRLCGVQSSRHALCPHRAWPRAYDRNHPTR
jgi:predicted Zn-dependent peptidase